MTKKTYNIFINSAYRDPSESAHSFRVDFLTGEIKCRDNQYITLNVLSFDMINSMYNINSNTGNNTFNVQRTNLDGSSPAIIQIIIPFGNYNVITLRDQLNSVCSGLLTVKYNQAQNTYTFSTVDLTHRYYIIPLKCSKWLGINTTTEITSVGTTGSFVNMVNYNKIILRCANLNFDFFTLENLSEKNNVLENSDIFFWKSKQDVEPFKMISYNNEDASSSYIYNLYNNDIDFLEVRVTNENNEEILDCPDFLLSLQFVVHDKKIDLITETVLKISLLLSDIKMLLLQALNFFGFFNLNKKKSHS